MKKYTVTLNIEVTDSVEAENESEAIFITLNNLDDADDIDVRFEFAEEVE